MGLLAFLLFGTFALGAAWVLFVLSLLLRDSSRFKGPLLTHEFHGAEGSLVLKMLPSSNSCPFVGVFRNSSDISLAALWSPRGFTQVVEDFDISDEVANACCLIAAHNIRESKI